MGEIDTKPIESVQVGVSIFGHRSDSIKHKSTSSSDSEENEKEKEVECLLKELANCKQQLEAKESAHKQSLFQLDHYRKLADQLSTQVKNYEIEGEKDIKQFAEATSHTYEIGSKMKTLNAEVEVKVEENSDQAFYIEELKLELDRAKSKLSAAKGIEIGLFIALEKIAEETENTKKENFKLKEEADRRDKHEISMKCELENVKKEMEAAMAKIRELRIRAGQAATRAEAAEKAKAEIENKVKRLEEKRKKRREALAAAIEESSSEQQPNKEIYCDPNFPNCEMMPTTSQPLGKILNIKFKPHI